MRANYAVQMDFADVGWRVSSRHLTHDDALAEVQERLAKGCPLFRLRVVITFDIDMTPYNGEDVAL